MGWDLYKRFPSFVLGFHGCDRIVGEAVIAGYQQLESSANQFDWLGGGVYFWEGNPARALEFAQCAATDAAYTTQGKISDPFVVGAVIDLGICFSLQDSNCLAELPLAYASLRKSCKIAGVPMPKNKGRDEDKGARFLDCAVIEVMHRLRLASTPPMVPYDTVRATFSEGKALYRGAGFSEKAHVQIAVRNTQKCILGYFRPLGAIDYK